MRKFHTVILLACASLGATLGATGAYARQSSATSSVDTAVPAQGLSDLSEADALRLMARGDNWAGTNVFKARLAKNDTPLNRFNLATGYQRTGRIDQARTLYKGLLESGRGVTVMATPSGAGEPVRTFDVADEAASRLLYISWLKSGHAPRVVAQAPNQTVSAEALAVDASATVGGPAHGEVSDAQALALDRMTQGAAP